MVSQFYIWRYLSPVHRICSKKVQGCHLVVFDSYENMNTKDMTHQRQSKGKAGATVTVAANMTITTNEEGPVFVQPNKWAAIYFHAEYKSNYKTYHAPGDAGLLIVQKAVQSATTSTTVLVGKDTDLIVLLCYHTIASLDYRDIFFRLQPKKNTKKLHIWNIRAAKEKLGQDICNNILFIHVIIGNISSLWDWKKRHPLTTSKQAVCCVSKQRCSILIQPPHMTW